MCLCVVLKWTRIPSRVYSCLTDSIPGIASRFTVNLIRSKWENTVRDRSHHRWEDHVIHFPLYSPSWHHHKMAHAVLLSSRVKSGLIACQLLHHGNFHIFQNRVKWKCSAIERTFSLHESVVWIVCMAADWTCFLARFRLLASLQAFLFSFFMGSDRSLMVFLFCWYLDGSKISNTRIKEILLSTIFCITW